jgi:hypothetical protein
MSRRAPRSQELPERCRMFTMTPRHSTMRRRQRTWLGGSWRPSSAQQCEIHTVSAPCVAGDFQCWLQPLARVGLEHSGRAMLPDC